MECRDAVPVTLVVGGEAAAGCAHLSVSEAAELGTLAALDGASRYATVILAPPLEVLGDAWPPLRALRNLVQNYGSLTVRHGLGSRPLSVTDVSNLLRLTGFEPGHTVRAVEGYDTRAERIPRTCQPLSCSVIVPCRNEVGNVDGIVERVPVMGTHTELVFVDGGSTDGTPDRIRALAREHPERDIKLLCQSGSGGKAGAVYQGFDEAEGDVLIILDADMAVAPEDLPRFYLALAEDVADFANGTRLVYPMEEGAMPPLNAAGNRAFSVLLSWLLDAPITDTLCGTKALFKRDWPRLAGARPLFGGHDPWGDFDLLLGAGYAKLRLIDVPVRYRARRAGESKMRPFGHGIALARTCVAGARRLKLQGATSRPRSC